MLATFQHGATSEIYVCVCVWQDLKTVIVMAKNASDASSIGHLGFQ